MHPKKRTKMAQTFLCQTDYQQRHPNFFYGSVGARNLSEKPGGKAIVLVQIKSKEVTKFHGIDSDEVSLSKCNWTAHICELHSWHHFGTIINFADITLLKNISGFIVAVNILIRLRSQQYWFEILTRAERLKTNKKD